MRVAIIDLGTNTFNLLIADVKEKGFSIVHKEKKAVKLGQGGINSGTITDAAFSRGLRAMYEYNSIINESKCDKTYAIATSALRDARNSNDFVDQVHLETGLAIDIISGEQEAELIFRGVQQTLPSGLEDYVIMDIGGGSTEFIIVKQQQVVWSRSYDLGVSRLLDWLKPSDPITDSEIEKLQARLNTELEEFLATMALQSINTLIGSSGSFDSFHDMLAAETQDVHSDDLEFSELKLNEISRLHASLLKSTLKERLSIEGLVEMRADMIVMSTLEINLVIEKCGITELYRSGYALKEGLLFSHVK